MNAVSTISLNMVTAMVVKNGARPEQGADCPPQMKRVFDVPELGDGAYHALLHVCWGFLENASLVLDWPA